MNHTINLYHRFLQLTATLVICLLAGTAFAQSPEKAKPDVLTIKSASKLMKREMPYQVIVPKDYSTNKDARYSVIYLLHGLYGHYNDFTRIPQSLPYFADRDFIFVFPEGGNGQYSDSATVENDKYESYLIKELIPEIDKNFRTYARREHRVIAGGSMGGYGALKFGLKYPEKFTLVGSFAGGFGATEVSEKTFGRIGKVIDTVFGPMGSESRKANGIRRLLNDLTPEQVKALPMIYQSCGTEDSLIGPNRIVLDLINKKKIPHEYREFPGKHDGAYFFPEIGAFIAVAERHLKKR